MAEAFEAMIGGKFAPLTLLDESDSEVTDLDSSTDNFNQAMHEQLAKFWARKEKFKKPWAKSDVVDLCDKRTELKKKKHETEGAKKYREIDKEIRKKAKTAKEGWIEDRCQEIKENLNSNNSKAAYQLVKQLTDKKVGRTTTIQRQKWKKSHRE